MAIDIQRARAFVEAQATPIEQARLKAVLDGITLSEVPAELRALQNEDGGYPFDLIQGRPSALVTTAHVLHWLRDLQLTSSTEAERALAFIAERQTPRGIWRERPELQQFNPPLWMDPESTAADVYTTAFCANTMAVVGDDELAVDQAVDWLQTQQGRDGLLAGFKAHSSWLAVPAFERVFGQETRATRRLIAGLGGILAADWPASMLAWLLQSVLDAGYTRRTALVDRAWTMLAAAQQPDGSFSAEEEDEQVQATLRALIVVQRLGRMR